jgi:hypothetical protein
MNMEIEKEVLWEGIANSHKARIILLGTLVVQEPWNTTAQIRKNTEALEKLVK